MEKRLLLVFPHPDDETYGCGGAIPKEVLAGTRVSLLTLTRGEASSQGPKLGLTPVQMGEKRAAELRRFAMQTVDRVTAEKAARALRFDTKIDCVVDVSEHLESKRIALDIQESIRDVINSDNAGDVLMRSEEHYSFWQEYFDPPVTGLFDGLEDAS